MSFFCFVLVSLEYIDSFARAVKNNEPDAMTLYRKCAAERPSFLNSEHPYNWYFIMKFKELEYKTFGCFDSDDSDSDCDDHVHDRFREDFCGSDDEDF